MPPMAGIVLRWLQLASGALGGRTGDIFGIPRSACVQAIASGAEMRDLQESTSDHDVLEKMDHLISVSEVVVKEDRRCQREHRKARRHFSNTKAKDQQQPAANFEGNGNCPAQRSQGQAHAADVGCRRNGERPDRHFRYPIILYDCKVSMSTTAVNKKCRAAPG